MNIETTILIDGGIGRTITAIPALEKFVTKNPNTYIITHGWTPIILGNPILTNYVFDNSTKNLFHRIKDSVILKPEPYFNSDYLNGKINLADAFNQVINHDKEKMYVPKLYLAQQEIKNTNVVKKGTTPTIAFQPFGSTAVITQDNVEDNTLRSLNKQTTLEIIKLLKSEGVNIFLVTDKQIPWLQRSDFVDYYPNNIRDLAATIYNCDYFIGIDSSAQHIARCFDKPGTVIIGGTNPINVTYPDHFNLFNHDSNRVYMPYRISDFDFWLGEIQNANILNFDNKKMKDCIANIKKHLRKALK